MSRYTKRIRVLSVVFFLLFSFVRCGSKAQNTDVSTQSGTNPSPSTTPSSIVTPPAAVTLYLQGTTIQVQCNGNNCTNTPISVEVLVTQVGATVTEVKSNSDGTFSIPILAGTYNVQIAPSSVPPDDDSVPQVATITNASVTLSPLELIQQ